MIVKQISVFLENKSGALSACINALGEQGYQLGLFSSDGFNASLYRQALLTAG